MEIEKEIQELKERNKRVELDKAWEVSWARRVLIILLTYIVAVVWLLLIKEKNSLLKAVVPVVGYILSTLSIPLLKKSWIGWKAR
jgi:hypothetical protein